MIGLPDAFDIVKVMFLLSSVLCLSEFLITEYSDGGSLHD